MLYQYQKRSFNSFMSVTFAVIVSCEDEKTGRKRNICMHICAAMSITYVLHDTNGIIDSKILFILYSI